MMRTLELRCNTSFVKFNEVYPILGSENEILEKAKANKTTIAIAGSNENPILIFFNEANMYNFLKFLCNNIL